jgi:hypothetical protein
MLKTEGWPEPLASGGTLCRILMPGLPLRDNKAAPAAVAVRMEFDRDITGTLQHHKIKVQRSGLKPADIFEANAPRLDGSCYTCLSA